MASFISFLDVAKFFRFSGTSKMGRF